MGRADQDDRFSIQAHRAVRLSSPVLSKIARRWFFTVQGLMPQARAMSLLLRPAATSLAISPSRVVSRSGFADALLVFAASFVGTAAYGGRFGLKGKKQGLKLGSRMGWIIMELPGLLVFPVIYFMGTNAYEAVPLFFLNRMQIGIDTSKENAKITK